MVTSRYKATSSTNAAERWPPIGKPLCCRSTTIMPVSLITSKSELCCNSHSTAEMTKSEDSSQKCGEHGFPMWSSDLQSLLIAKNWARLLRANGYSIQKRSAGITRSRGVLRKQSSTSNSTNSVDPAFLATTCNHRWVPWCIRQMGTWQPIFSRTTPVASATRMLRARATLRKMLLHGCRKCEMIGRTLIIGGVSNNNDFCLIVK